MNKYYIYLQSWADILLLLVYSSLKYLIRGGVRKGSVCKANAFICGIQHEVKALQKGLPVNEVKTWPAIVTNIIHYKVNGAGSSADQAVNSTRPKLSIGSQLESSLYIHSTVSL